VECENTLILEENLEDICSSIIVDGVVGFETLGGNILDLSFSRWQLKLFPISMAMQDLSNFLKSLEEFLDFKLISCNIIEDNANYTLLNQGVGIIEFENIIVYNSQLEFDNHSILKMQPVLITQSMGFGTGKHHTTAMCINFIEELKAENFTPMNVLDLGCGSGILAIIVAKLFATKTIIASDIDSFAIDTTIDFLVRNNVNNKVNTFVSNGFEKLPAQNYNLILANILLEPLINMVDDFYNCLSKGGYLVVSGFLQSQVKELSDIYNKRGFSLLKTKTSDQWCAILFTK
jgi:ribosomal protein L11 methylase PrmA